jgi:hypothetical protein
VLPEDTEDMKAYKKKHCFAVAHAHEPYKEQTEESEIINYLLRKVVLMRELPLVKATKNLAFLRDIGTIDKQTKKLKSVSTRSQRYQQRLSQNQNMMHEQSMLTQGFDGSQQDINNTQNRVTFKVKNN